jgi:hypothetical protein
LAGFERIPDGIRVKNRARGRDSSHEGPAVYYEFGKGESYESEATPMTTSPKLEGTSDVPAQVFEKFLEALGDAGESAELVARLRKALLEEKKFTERALKEAILPEEQLP